MSNSTMRSIVKSIKKIHLVMICLCIVIWSIFNLFSPLCLELVLEGGISPKEFSSFGHLQLVIGLFLGSSFGVGIAAIKPTMSKSPI
jgi:ABC-type multidrug transport system fused ATPase/permease subunit